MILVSAAHQQLIQSNCNASQQICPSYEFLIIVKNKCSLSSSLLHNPIRIRCLENQMTVCSGARQSQLSCSLAISLSPLVILSYQSQLWSELLIKCTHPVFDEIFTYSQSISSSCKNSLVSARKGKRGSRAHIELSYFVSFFSTPAHSFHLITSPPPLKFLVFFVVPSFLVHACLCFFPGKHH